MIRVAHILLLCGGVPYEIQRDNSMPVNFAVGSHENME